MTYLMCAQKIRLVVHWISDKIASNTRMERPKSVQFLVLNR